MPEQDKQFELLSVKVTGTSSPYGLHELVNLIHDEYFTLEDIRYLSDERVLVIPYRRMFHGRPRRTTKSGLLFKEEEVDVIRSELRIHHVESYEVSDPDQIGVYAFNDIFFDEERSILTIDTCANLEITIKISDIFVESNDLEIKGKSRIRYLGPVEITTGKVYE